MGARIGMIAPQALGIRRISHVVNTGVEDPEHYYFHIGGPLVMHMDPVDVVGLLCIRRACSGGESRVVSSMAVHNCILETRPDLLEILYQGFYNHRRRATREGGAPVTDYRCPLFARLADAELICSYIPSSIERAVALGNVRLNDKEREALACLNEVAQSPDLFIDMDLQPGNVQLLNNRVTLHARTDYTDWPEMERRRRLLRVWMTLPGWPKYPPTIVHIDAETGAGAA